MAAQPDPDPQLTPPPLAQALHAHREQVRVADFYQGGDAAPALLAAIQAAHGRSVDISGDWTFHSACDASGYPAHLVGRARIDASAVPEPYPLILGGREGASAPLAADARQGESMLICALPLQPGELLRLVSSEPWSRERPYYVKGELARVAQVDGERVTLAAPLNDDYRAAATSMTRLHAQPVTVHDGLELIRNANSGGLLVQWSANLALNRCLVAQAQERGLYLKQCLGGYLADCGCYADYPAGGRTNYGLALASCADLRVVGGSYRAGRHALSTGGTFPCRDLTFADVTFDNDSASGSYCLDAHANGERFSYRDVTALNGAVIQAVDCRFSGGSFRSRSFLNALSLYPARDSRYYSLHDVSIENTRAGGRGLTLSPAASGLDLGQFRFSGGSIAADIPFYCIPADRGTTRFASIEFEDGFRLLCTRDGANVGSLLGPNRASAEIGRVRFANGSIFSNGAGVALAIRSGARSIGYAAVVGCLLEHHGANACVAISQAAQAEFSHNHGFGHGLSRGAEIADCSTVDVRGNQMHGFTRDGGVYLAP